LHFSSRPCSLRQARSACRDRALHPRRCSSSHAPPPPPPPSTGAGTGTANTGVAAPQRNLSENAARAQIEAYICTAQWFQLHALEGRVGESGVPVSALQLATRSGRASSRESAAKGGPRSNAPPANTRAIDCIGLSATNEPSGGIGPLLVWTQDGEYSSTSSFCWLALSLELLTKPTAHSAVPPRKACRIIAAQGPLLLRAAFGESLRFYEDQRAPHLFASFPPLQW